MLPDREWNLKYTPEDGDLVKLFYVPALEDAERYDRLTGYFNAGALALAARGVEGLVRNGGRMRLVVGCTLDPPEIEAIERGEALREQVEKRLTHLPLAPPDPGAADALELLAWMVGRNHLDVKVAVPCDATGKPIHDRAIFHEKAGIIEDRAGNRIAWTGSLNETAAGWRHNWESISVYTSWGPEPGRVNGEERNFARLWAGTAGAGHRARRARGGATGPDAVHAKRPARACLQGNGKSGRRMEPGTQTDPSAVVPGTPGLPPAHRSAKPRLDLHPGSAQPRTGRCPRRRSNRRGGPVAPSGAGVRATLRQLAPEAADRRRSRARKDHPGGDAAPPGLALGESEADPHPCPQGGPRPMAD